MNTTRNRITIIESADKAVIRVRGWRAADLAREAGLRPTDIGPDGWVLSYSDYPTLLAYLEHRQIPVKVLTERSTHPGNGAAR